MGMNELSFHSNDQKIYELQEQDFVQSKVRKHSELRNLVPACQLFSNMCKHVFTYLAPCTHATHTGGENTPVAPLTINSHHRD